MQPKGLDPRTFNSHIMPSYFFLAVSNQENLKLCKRYALAGFTSNINGAWAFSEINEGDYISFLYGARAHNLYQVVHKEAIKNAEHLPPWKPLTFRESGKTYHFPFRLYLKQVRTFEEPIVRAEFSYIAENLLLRGGYRKTHFQADMTTLQNVSQMGEVFNGEAEALEMPPYETFTPMFVRSRKVSPPYILPFREVILQALVRRYLMQEENLKVLFEDLNLEHLRPESFEILSEKALPQGHVDILIKEAVPIGMAKKIVVEVKLGRTSKASVDQLKSYMAELGEECVAGVLIAGSVPRMIKEEGIHLFRYEFGDLDMKQPQSFDALKLCDKKIAGL